MGNAKVIRALALSCHPIPAMAVTSMSAGLGALAELPIGRGALMVCAIFTGQLSIGWCNDYLDAERDRAVMRHDKPVAVGSLKPRVAAVAAVAALAASLALSVALGWAGGGAAAVIVLCGWAYNFGVKATVWSWLPYALAFGMLPAVATLSAVPARWPAAWALSAGALLGVAAHLANVLPDLGDDLDMGIRGLPHRIGGTATAWSAAGILLIASAVILFGPIGQPDAWRWAGFAAATVVAAVAVRVAYTDPASRRVFQAITLIAALDLLSFAGSGVAL
ncbi:MAG: UbiA family prenyltransferase [Candidatus Nanopelagicales bacterium]